MREHYRIKVLNEVTTEGKKLYRQNTHRINSAHIFGSKTRASLRIENKNETAAQKNA